VFRANDFNHCRPLRYAVAVLVQWRAASWSIILAGALLPIPAPVLSPYWAGSLLKSRRFQSTSMPRALDIRYENAADYDRHGTCGHRCRKVGNYGHFIHHRAPDGACCFIRKDKTKNGRAQYTKPSPHEYTTSLGILSGTWQHAPSGEIYSANRFPPLQ
jgi:hypothetical protein